MSVGTGRTYGASCLDKRYRRGGDRDRIHVGAGPLWGCPIFPPDGINEIASGSQSTSAELNIVDSTLKIAMTVQIGF